MDPFSALMLAYAGYNMYQGLTADQPDRPSLPNYIPPDPTLLKEFSGWTDRQNQLRSKLLAEYYGGKAVNRGMDTSIGYSQRDEPGYYGDPLPIDNRLTPRTAGSVLNPRIVGPTDLKDPIYENKVDIADWNGGTMPTNRWEADLTFKKPAMKYLESQRGVVDKAQGDADSEMKQYFAERGIEPGGAIEGFNAELGKDFNQRRLDINSRAEDIYTQTMASIGFPEFSQAGPQAAMLAANVGNASNVFNNSMAQSYQQALQQWQYNLQGGQENQFGQAFGQILPLLYQLYGGGGTPSPYYGSAHAYQPGNTSMGWLG